MKHFSSIVSAIGKSPFLYLFPLALIVRVFFFIISDGDIYRYNADSFWLERLAQEALTGNFSFDIGRFIVSPLYPSLIAGSQFIFGENGNYIIVFFQIIFASLSVYYIYKIAAMLYNACVAALSALIYTAFPLTLWWTHTLSTESIFQSLLITSIYFYVRFKKGHNFRDYLFFCVFITFSFLTKSHILIFIGLLPLVMLLDFGKQSFIKLNLYLLFIFLILNAPFTWYQWKKNNELLFSSNGAWFQFYTGHSPFGYTSIVEVPEAHTARYQQLQSLQFEQFNEDYETILSAPIHQRQHIAKTSALRWMKENPGSCFQLTVYNLFFSLMPGVSWRHYDFVPWLIVLLISAPLYLLAYLNMWHHIRQRQKDGYLFIALFMAVVIMATLFYVQNRFRTITYEPFMIILASVSIDFLLQRKNRVFMGDGNSPLSK